MICSTSCRMLVALACGGAASVLAGCANDRTSPGASQTTTTHLSATQCVDLTAARQNEPVTHARAVSELAALEQAGYNPGWRFDPYYPEDLQKAQRRVDAWYRNECPQARSG